MVEVSDCFLPLAAIVAIHPIHSISHLLVTPFFALDPSTQIKRLLMTQITPANGRVMAALWLKLLPLKSRFSHYLIAVLYLVRGGMPAKEYAIS